MKTIKIFIASSRELKQERVRLELLLNRKNLRLKEKNTVLEPVLWEILEKGFGKVRKQDDFNKALLDCEIVICLFYKIVGKFTIEEFEKAYESFKAPDRKPFKLYVFFKEAEFKSEEYEQAQKIEQLKKKIEDEYQEFYETYKTIEDLENQISKELELLLDTISEKQIEQAPPEKKILEKYFVPRRSDNFVDRNKEIDKIIKCLKNFKVVQVQGLAGIGKSDLATEIAYRVEDYFADGIIWHYAKQTSIDEIMNVIAKAFNIENLQGSKEEKIVVIKQTLSKKKVLLIFDNVEKRSEEAIREILDIANECAILIATRTTENIIFKKAEQFRLGELESDQTFMLIEKIGKINLTNEQKNAIRELYDNVVGGIPLALELIITWAIRREFEIQKLSDWLKEKGLESIVKHEEKLESIFRNSYDCLNIQEKKIYSTMGIFGGQTFDLDALKFITKDEETELHVYNFISLSLVKRATMENRFYLHPLLKFFAQKEVTDPNIYDRMIQYFNSYAKKYAENFDKLDMEKNNIYGALDMAYEKKDYQKVMEFIDSLIGKNAYYGFLARKGYWTEAIKRLEQAKKASIELNDREFEARQYENLGLFHYWLGNNKEARDFYDNALEIFFKMKNIHETIRVYHNMGYIEDDENFYQKARKLYEDSLMLSKEINNEELIALSYHLVGVIDYHQGRYDDARKNIEMGLKINEHLCKHSAISRSKRRFAAVARMQAHYSTGEQKQRYIEESFALINDSLGEEEIERSKARGQRQLGMIYEENGQIDIAHECYLESRRIFESIGNKKGIGTVSYNLGSIAQKKGALVKAKSYYEESIRIAQLINSRYGIASALRQLGLIALTEKENSKAKDYLSESFRIFNEIDSTFKGEVKELLDKIN